jgi:hypothetical protein
VSKIPVSRVCLWLLSGLACGGPEDSAPASETEAASREVPVDVDVSPPARLATPAAPGGDFGDLSVTEQGAAGYEVRARDAAGMVLVSQCGGSCEEVCSCLEAACTTAQPDWNCGGAAVACIAACSTSSCLTSDPNCGALLPMGVASPDPEPGGAGPDPSPIDGPRSSAPPPSAPVD